MQQLQLWLHRRFLFVVQFPSVPYWSTPLQPNPPLLTAPGGGGGGGSFPGGAAGTDINSQIALTLVRLQQDMNDVLNRVNALEERAGVQVYSFPFLWFISVDVKWQLLQLFTYLQGIAQGSGKVNTGVIMGLGSLVNLTLERMTAFFFVIKL